MKNLLQDHPSFTDKRGKLVALEALTNVVPFDIKRVYFLYDLKSDEPRGFHAHKKLEQALICINGSCKVHMDDGKKKRDFILNKPYQVLIIPKCFWHLMSEFSENTIILVLASDPYDREDYIRNYDDFLAYIQKKER
jgi:dTDP-4-dehydrorhamnose 3,5-epimerase-like enzyme